MEEKQVSNNNQNPKKGNGSLSNMRTVFSVGEATHGKLSFFQLYAALMILLMTFFIVIFAYSTYSQSKFKLAQESLFEAFEALGIAETREIISFLKSKLNVTSSDDHRQLLISLSEISSELEKEFNGSHVSLRRYETVIVIPDDKVFADDKFVFKKDAHEMLNKIVKYIQKDIYSQIVISGHFTSQYPTATTVKSNRFDWLISSLRAARVAQYFVEKKLDYTRISSIGYGSHHPIYDLDKLPSTKLEENNRIEIIIKKPDAPPEEERELYFS